MEVALSSQTLKAWPSSSINGGEIEFSTIILQLESPNSKLHPPFCQITEIEY
jgi:hypothetical protein